MASCDVRTGTNTVPNTSRKPAMLPSCAVALPMMLEQETRTRSERATEAEATPTDTHATGTAMATATRRLRATRERATTECVLSDATIADLTGLGSDWGWCRARSPRRQARPGPGARRRLRPPSDLCARVPSRGLDECLGSVWCEEVLPDERFADLAGLLALRIDRRGLCCQPVLESGRGDNLDARGGEAAICTLRQAFAGVHAAGTRRPEPRLYGRLSTRVEGDAERCYPQRVGARRAGDPQIDLRSCWDYQVVIGVRPSDTRCRVGAACTVGVSP